ncbi:Uncharacterized protein TCM_000769 [Theobroma cacao]|uniref:Uncharacterized protein n=1 Tax=Theobroma cacao TaxID=3641 RepID=A0A061DH04_THECC|nr:Uncharacterized protein TCM_000769 [Theobroma cacao]
MCEIIRDGMKECLTPMGPTPLLVSPIFEVGFSELLVFEGMSIDENGRQQFLIQVLLINVQFSMPLHTFPNTGCWLVRKPDVLNDGKSIHHKEPAASM